MLILECSQGCDGREQSPLILTELNELKKTMTCDIGNPGLGLGQAQKCGRGNVKVCNFLRYNCSRVASQNHLVKLDSCFQDLSMLCAKYQSSGIAGSQEEDF
jgi:hypothetical protein